MRQGINFPNTAATVWFRRGIRHDRKGDRWANFVFHIKSTKGRARCFCLATFWFVATLFILCSATSLNKSFKHDVAVSFFRDAQQHNVTYPMSQFIVASSEYSKYRKTANIASFTLYIVKVQASHRIPFHQLTTSETSNRNWVAGRKKRKNWRVCRGRYKWKLLNMRFIARKFLFDFAFDVTNACPVVSA